MLATVIKGELATQQSIFIMRAFKEMRHLIKQNQQFIERTEMNLIRTQVSQIATQVTNVIDHQLLTDKNIEVI